MKSENYKAIFSDKSGMAAYIKLKAALLSGKLDDIVTAENDFIASASKLLAESTDISITGQEAKSHALLHHILVQYESGGAAALDALAISCTPRI